MQRTREEAKLKLIEATLADFESEVLILEGAHDVGAMRKLGVGGITVNQLLADGYNIVGAKVAYVAMDIDHRADDKKDHVISFLRESYPTLRIDTTTAERFQKALGVSSMEQAVGPITELRKKVNGGKRSINW